MKTTKRQIKFLEPKDINRIIRAVPDDARGRRDVAIMETLFSTGLRISEALALTVDDIKEDGTTQELSITGKGGWQRVVYFSPQALKAIRYYLLNRIENDTAVFPLTARRVQKMLKERAREAGLGDKHISPHVFRHSFATDLLGRGVDLRMVQRFLGHRAISSTEVYTHVTDKQLKDIHAKLYGNK